jgi:hypothetical protein
MSIIREDDSIASEPAQDTPILDFVREICDRFGPRPPGTAAEAKAARFIAERLEEFCDEVSVEEHHCSPQAARGSTTLFLMGYLLCLLAYLFAPAVAAVMLGFLFLILYLTRVKGYEVVDRLFPRERLQNVIGKVKPAEKSERIVIFSGHHDSSHYMPLFEKRRRKLLVPLFGSIMGSHFVLGLTIGTRLLGDYLVWMTPVSWFLFGLSCVGGIVFLFFRTIIYSDVPVMGANDNLASVAVAVQAARHFAENRPRRTEVWAISFGSEECGLRGSKRFAKKHRAELSTAYLIDMEMIGAAELTVIEREKTVRRRHSPEVISLIEEAARRCGVAMGRFVLRFGATDATSFSRLGLKAATIIAVDEEGFPPNWHVLEDTPEGIEETCLRKTLKVCIECVNLLEEGRPADASEKGES